MSAKEIARTAPAKINLALHVVGQRADGRHLLETLVTFSNDGDLIRVTAAEEDSFAVTGPFAAYTGPVQDNLVIRARDLLRRQFAGSGCRPVAIRLEKNLPAAAGLGGGSSDAVAAMFALAALWELPTEGFAKLALPLGADLPMCVLGRPLVARGIGEVLEPLDEFPSLPLLLVNPGGLLPTVNVFAALAEKHNPPLPLLPTARTADAVTRWLATVRNDLEPPASGLHPPVAAVLAALHRAGAVVARMSGSGATCFGLFTSAAARDVAEAALRSKFPAWFVRAADSLEAKRPGSGGLAKSATAEELTV